MRYAALASLMLLSACASPKIWTKPGGSEQQFYADRYECEQQAANSYPPAPTQIQTSAGYQAPQQRQTQTNCQATPYGQVNCTTRPTGIDTSIYNTPPQYVTIDANTGNRNSALSSCLMARGYRLQPR